MGYFYSKLAYCEGFTQHSLGKVLPTYSHQPHPECPALIVLKISLDCELPRTLSTPAQLPIHVLSMVDVF